MNHQERASLGVILDQLWEYRTGFNDRQRELLTAAMRIVAGDPNSSTLPNPWPTSEERWETAPRHAYTNPPTWIERLLARISR